MIPGGDPHLLPFDADVCAEWLTDRIDILAPLATAIFDSFAAHQAALGEQKKS